MGEVYRARDTKLGREVALKILPAEFEADPDRVARFAREARLLAALNHPNIATIHGVEEGAGATALVMELVEGDTLENELRHGVLPLARALDLARQIVEALEAAHERGIIHRDLKPANIKITPSGVVKVLDFGLAKAVTDELVPAAVTQSPTKAGSGTEAGVILGTAAYMSPEQARGLAVDKRTDVWAFGCVLYELLTGKGPFAGGTLSDSIALILQREPDWNALPASTPAAVRRVLIRCLTKDLRQRWQDISDVRIGLADALTEPSAAAPSREAVPLARGRSWLPWTVAALTSIGAIVAWYPRPPAPTAEVHAEITTPPTSDAVSLAMSPDASAIAFVATSNGQSQLWLRPLGSTSGRPLAGTERASYPFWSPDGKALGFFADSKLKTIELESGSVRMVSYAAFPSGATWNGNGVILFVPGAGTPVSRVSDKGGEPAPVVRLEAPRQFNHRSPQFLPDGRHFLYYVAGTPEARGVYIGDIDGGQSSRLLDSDSTATYAASGHLLFVRQGTLYGQAFAPDRLSLAGSPIQIANGIAVDPAAVAPVSASRTGPIAYRAGVLAQQRRFAWFDRKGSELQRVGDVDNSSPFSPTLSPDGRRVVLYRTIAGNADIWILETSRAVFTRFTSDTTNEINPIWSPDGESIVFSANHKGVFDLFRQPTSGTGPAQLLFADATNKLPLDWSPDGRFLLYRSLVAETGYDLWAWSSDKVIPVAKSMFAEREGQFSPDGRWVAYQSDQSGRFEIYVQPFPEATSKIQISSNGGAQVRWARNGKELFFVALDGGLMAVPIVKQSNAVLETGIPVALFVTHIGGAVAGPQKQQYVVSADGQRFLMNTVVEDAPSPISLVLNWKGNPLSRSDGR